MVFGMLCHASLKKGVRVCEFPKELLIRILHVEQDMQDMATTCTCKSLKGDKSYLLSRFQRLLLADECELLGLCWACCGSRSSPNLCIKHGTESFPF